MSLKLNSSGGGSVTLQEPSTASDRTLTLPDNTGTVVSTASTGVVTPTMLSTGAPSWDSSGNLSFNSGYGSVATAYGCRAWVNFNGTGTPTIRSSGNVSSITDGGVGQYTVNFSTSMPDTNYAVVGTAATSGTANGFVLVPGDTGRNTGSTFVYSITVGSSPTFYDTQAMNVAIFR
jgi:hypothetical protein